MTFLTDGGEEVRALTELIAPGAEHVLDWFHITMRLTILGQYARGIAQHDDAEAPTCSPHWTASSGCYGTATSIGPARRS